MTRPRASPLPGPIAASPASECLSPQRLLLVLGLLALTVAYELAESFLWQRSLWGAHFYGFLPHAALLLVLVPMLCFMPHAERWLPPPGRPLPERAARGMPWLAALCASALFWTLRERHLFWGDALPLSIDIPAGQAFHPDEPLTLFIHQALYRLGGGRWSGATAVALGSVAAGGAFVGWALHWFTRRFQDPAMAVLATAVLAAQGFSQLFFGHVENYSYLALALLVFFTTGLDFLEGRGGILRPLLALAFAYALHILGGLALVPALVLIVVGLRHNATRWATLASVATVAVVVAVGASLASDLYRGESPFARLSGGVLKVLANPQDMNAVALLSWRHAANLWSEFVLLGPLSVPLAAALTWAMGARAFARGATGRFLILGALAFYGAFLLTGEGNLGAARNWDLFAAPGVAPALWGIIVVAGGIEPRQSRRVLLALLGVSVFHTAPWVILNASEPATIRRVAALPLTQGRAPMMLGTYFLNSGKLSEAERWFQEAARLDPENVNTQSGLGLALARQGKLRQALGPMRAAVRLSPRAPRYRYDLVALLLTLEDWRGGARQLEAVLHQDPHEKRSWLSLARCYAGLGRPDTTALVLQSALDYFPEDPEVRGAMSDACDAWARQAEAHGDRSETARAIAVLAAALPGDPRLSEWRARLQGSAPR